MATEKKKNGGFRKIVFLTFPPDMSGKPIVSNLVRLFDLDFNILKADINPRQQGTMTLEITGRQDSFQEGVNYLKENGLRITPVAQKIFRDEDKCIHCGMCTAVCPTESLSVSRDDMLVEFDVDRCSACSMCTRVCPVGAMTVDLD